MKKSPLNVQNFGFLESLSTRQLLARLKRLLQCEESLALSDKKSQVCSTLEFKQTNEWAEAYAHVKAVLAHREHIAAGKTVRKERARQNRTASRYIGKRQLI